MSDKTAAGITRVLTIAVLLVTLAGTAQTFLFLPRQVNAQEERIRILESSDKTNHDLLVRIDERVAQLIKEEDNRK
jgi:hypothetical protein